jgi:predicted cation transporter
MEQIPVEIGLIPIIAAVLLGPLLIKRIEHNLEAFLLLMGAAAVAISRSWHIGLVEEAIQEPAVVGIVLASLVAGLIIHYHRPGFLHGINESLLDRITLKVIFLEIVVVLGLSAAVITPIIPFFVLVEVVNHLPIQRRTRAILLILACLSIGMGAAMALVEWPVSTIAVARMQGSLPSATLLPLGLQSLYLPCILVIGLISTFFARDGAATRRMWNPESSAAFKNVAIWSARVCMFAGALLLVGVAFGVNF